MGYNNRSRKTKVSMNLVFNSGKKIKTPMGRKYKEKAERLEEKRRERGKSGEREREREGENKFIRGTTLGNLGAKNQPE